MKTAISIPDPVFQAGESLAFRLGLSRSELYTKALQSFITSENKQEITEALNRIYDVHSSQLEPMMAQLQFASLLREEW